MQHTAVAGHFGFQAGAHHRRVRADERHGLALHVRAHERAVGVVVFEEGNQLADTPTIWLGATSMYSTSSG
jgi:hypothetical protein